MLNAWKEKKFVKTAITKYGLFYKITIIKTSCWKFLYKRFTEPSLSLNESIMCDAIIFVPIWELVWAQYPYFT